MQSTVTAKGQIAIPKSIRDAIGISAGHRSDLEDKIWQLKLNK